MTTNQIIAKALDPRTANLGSVGAKLVAASKAHGKRV